MGGLVLSISTAIQLSNRSISHDIAKEDNEQIVHKLYKGKNRVN